MIAKDFLFSLSLSLSLPIREHRCPNWIEFLYLGMYFTVFDDGLSIFGVQLFWTIPISAEISTWPVHDTGVSTHLHLEGLFLNTAVCIMPTWLAIMLSWMEHDGTTQWYLMTFRSAHKCDLLLALCWSYSHCGRLRHSAWVIVFMLLVFLVHVCIPPSWQQFFSQRLSFLPTDVYPGMIWRIGQPTATSFKPVNQAGRPQQKIQTTAMICIYIYISFILQHNPSA